jgi:polyhydroxybutyrate depolymerase
MKHLLSVILFFLVATNILYAGWSNTSFTFDGSTRAYRTYVAANYDPNKPASLIVVLHGLGGSMNDAAGMGITNIADTANIILLSPQALDYDNPLALIEAAWNSGIEITIPGFATYAVNADVDDVGFIKAIIDTAKANYSVNNARVYVCGASMGGFMTQRLACEAADEFAAVASVMGTYAKALPPCNPGKVLPVAHFHGTNDEVISYNGDLLYSGNSFPVGLSVDSLIAKWVTNNDCNTTPQHDTWPDSNNDNLYVEHFTYSDVNMKSRVELFKVNGGTHFWYQNANTGGEFDYSIEIWKFFNKQYANSLGVTDISEQATSIKLFPNPAQSQLYIKSDVAIKRVELMDIYGKVFYAENNTEKGLDISTLSPGIYFAKIQVAKGGLVLRKFVKQ